VRWEPFDPTRLIALARSQHPAEPWLPAALSRCTICRREARGYLHFVDLDADEAAEDDWDFDRNIVLTDPEQGEVVLDVLTGHRVSGADFRRFV